MALIREEEINEIRSKADIVDVINHFVPLNRSGKEYRGKCPFHDDHDPSLHVSQEKQIFKCFVCGAGGNVFSFVRKFENVSFPEAVKRVADLTGYHLSVSVEEESPEQKDPRRTLLHRIMDETVKYTMYQLDTEAGAGVKKYLRERGMDENVCRKFQIGYNPAGESLYRFLKAKGYRETDMVDVNLVRIQAAGISDVFADRITFPIHDENGNPIAFSARTIRSGVESKYINTNETEIFTKGNTVYNYHRARNTARREGKIYVCEGVTDVIALDRAGIENAVATLGTACTTRQISLLKRIAARITFCYDGDHAGQAAILRAGKMARQAGCEVSVIRNETGQDPDEILMKSGAGALQELMKQEISWMEFVFSHLRSSYNLNNYLEKREFAQKVYEEIEQLDDEVDRKYFADQLADLTGFRFDVPAAVQVAVPLRKTASLISVPDGTRRAEEMILEMMMSSPRAVQQFEEKLGYMLDEKHQAIAMMMIDAVHTSGKVNPGALIDATDDLEMQSLIVELMDHETPYDEAVMNGAIRRILIAALEKEADAYRQQLGMELNQETRELILNRYDECLKKRRRYIDEENSK